MEREEVILGEPDVAALTLEARPVALAAADVYLRHTRPWFIGLLAHGSALKGGFIPGCSDVDLQLYLRDEAFDTDGRIPFDLGLAIQRDLASVPLGPFAYVQCYALPPGMREGWIGPVPGAYHMLLGRLPRPEATSGDLRASALRALDGLSPIPDYIADGMLTFSLARLERHARLLCTDVWPFVYHVLTVAVLDPIAAWRLPRTEAIAHLPLGPLRQEAEGFLRAVHTAFASAQTADGFIAALAQGIRFRAEVDTWFRSRPVE